MTYFVITRMQPSPENIKMARAVAGAIGFEPQVFPYYDNDRSHQLDILKLTDPIDQAVGIYMTIGLSDYENKVDVSEGFENIPVELFLTAYKEFDKAPNILSTCAFFILKDKYECRPGNVFKYMIAEYYPEKEMKHVYFHPPFLWQDKLEALAADIKKTAFLLIVPISDAELDYKLAHGDDALESLFEENNIDVFNLDRRSVC